MVLYDLTEKSGVKFKAYYAATGIDAPELVMFIKEYYPDVTWKRPFMTRKRKHPNWKGTHSFFKMLQVKGFPTRKARWCCDVLKKDPTKNVPLKHRLLGIRAEESSARAKRGQISEYRKQVVYYPIFYWLEWEVWDYIELHNLPYCTLYDEGFSRLGCVVCPFICHGVRGQLKRNMERWPHIYKLFEKSMKKLFDNYECVVNSRSGAMNYRREDNFKDFIDNWYKGI